MKHILLVSLIFLLAAHGNSKNAEFKPTIGVGYNHIRKNPDYVNAFPNPITVNAGFFATGPEERGSFIYDFFYNTRTYDYQWPNAGSYSKVEQNFNHQINIRMHLGNRMKNYFHGQFGMGILGTNTRTFSKDLALDAFVHDFTRLKTRTYFTFGAGYSRKIKENKLIFFFNSAYGKQNDFKRGLSNIAGIQFAFSLKKVNK